MSNHEEKEVAALSYKDTLNLPTTDFPIRAQAHIFDPQVLERWEKEGLCAQAFDHNKGKEQFINPLYNFNHPLFVDSSKFYDAYVLTYKVERNDNFSSLDGQENKLTVIFEHDCNTNTISTLAALYQTAMNSIANAQGFASVSL